MFLATYTIGWTDITGVESRLIWSYMFKIEASQGSFRILINGLLKIHIRFFEKPYHCISICFQKLFHIDFHLVYTHTHIYMYHYTNYRNLYNTTVCHQVPSSRCAGRYYRSSLCPMIGFSPKRKTCHYTRKMAANGIGPEDGIIPLLWRHICKDSLQNEITSVLYCYLAGLRV